MFNMFRNFRHDLSRILTIILHTNRQTDGQTNTTDNITSSPGLAELIIWIVCFISFFILPDCDVDAENNLKLIYNHDAYKSDDEKCFQALYKLPTIINNTGTRSNYELVCKQLSFFLKDNNVQLLLNLQSTFPKMFKYETEV